MTYTLLDMPDLVGPAPKHMTYSLPNYLRTHRKRCGLTLKEVAFLLGHESGHIVGRYEQMTRSPSLDSAFACQVVFDVVPHELFPAMYQKVEKLTIRRISELRQVLEVMAPDPTLSWKLAALDKVLAEAEMRRLHV